MIDRTNNPSLPRECVDSVLWMQRSRVAQSTESSRNVLAITEKNCTLYEYCNLLNLFLAVIKAMLKTTQCCSCDKNYTCRYHFDDKLYSPCLITGQSWLKNSAGIKPERILKY